MYRHTRNWGLAIPIANTTPRLPKRWSVRKRLTILLLLGLAAWGVFILPIWGALQ